jgi:hypothetical protein
MLARDFRERVTHGIEEVLVGRTDRPVHAELDDGLRLADGRDLSVVVGDAQLLLGDVGGKFDDLERLAGLVEYRIVGGENPDFLAALADALVLRGLKLAAIQGGPELAVRSAVAHRRFDQHAVMLAPDFLKRVTEYAEEVLVRCDDGAIRIELDQRLGFTNGRRLCEGAPQLRLASQTEHLELRPDGKNRMK